MAVVLRITRHAADLPRVEYLRSVYGSEVLVVTEDVPYGDDPVASVKALIERTETENGNKVVALEAQAPFPVLTCLVGARRELGVAFIRAQFVRGEDGRVKVAGKDEKGRDLFEFSHYEELEKIEFQTRRLGAPKEEDVPEDSIWIVELGEAVDFDPAEGCFPVGHTYWVARAATSEEAGQKALQADGDPKYRVDEVKPLAEYLGAHGVGRIATADF